ncbi:MAG: aminotransferase class V-fold PLP-dependent enzyme [Oligoflexia bacterium]|nr:aminotransferase class V-fold PLP-dependent enzyme [Oligoflexia bacterium]
MIYFNNAATSYPKPPNVKLAVNDYFNHYPVGQNRNQLGGEDLILNIRKRIAKFLGIKNCNNLFFTSGATEGLNLLIAGLNVEEGDHLVTTENEHNSVLRPLYRLIETKKIKLDIVATNEYGIINVSDIIKYVNSETKAVIVNHVSNVTGFTLDIEQLALQIKQKSKAIIIVDGSQSVGYLPIDLSRMNAIDAFAFSGHKSLWALEGIGAVYISESLINSDQNKIAPLIAPLKVGGTGVKSESLKQPTELPIYYESGTQNIIGIISLAAGVDFITSIGLEKINQRVSVLSDYLVDKLQAMPEIISPSFEIEIKNSIISFNILNHDPSEVAFILSNSFDIIVREGLHCAPLISKRLGFFPKGSIRVGLSYFNTEGEIDFFIDSIKKIISSKC